MDFFQGMLLFIYPAFNRPKPGAREEYLRVSLTEDMGAGLAGDQGSGVLSSVGRADGLAIIPVGEVVKAGDEVDVILISEFLSPSAAG